jgi:hypothetical protein
MRVSGEEEGIRDEEQELILAADGRKGEPSSMTRSSIYSKGDQPRRWRRESRRAERHLQRRRVAYYLLTAQPPFVRGTTLRTLAAHISDPVIPPDRLRPDLPADLQTVLVRCLVGVADPWSVLVRCRFAAHQCTLTTLTAEGRGMVATVFDPSGRREI